MLKHCIRYSEQVIKLLLYAICLLCLGAGVAWQFNNKRAFLYPLSVILITAVFILFRGFSHVYGVLLFSALILLCYFFYWYDWWRLHNKTTCQKNAYLICVTWIVLSTTCITVFLYFSAAISGYQIYHIPSKSMAPTLNPGDYVLVDLWRYKNKPALKDEIVVFKHPYKNKIYIKR